jgi:predicted phosphodiesterase
MRYGLISDIHANLHALEAALTALQREEVDGYLCLGDLVGYGPFPNECVARVAELGAQCVAGNHDLIALGQLSEERCIPLAQQSLRWTRDVLRDDTRRYLAALPRRLEVTPEIVLAHGSLDDPQEYITRPEQAERQLAQLAREYPAARHLLLGHTHRQWSFPGSPGSAGTPRLLNPGSVGQSRDRQARVRFALLDLERAEARFFSEPYDVAACRAALRKQGLPPAACHLAPSLLRACAGRVKRLARKALQLRPV